MPEAAGSFLRSSGCLTICKSPRQPSWQGSSLPISCKQHEAIKRITLVLSLSSPVGHRGANRHTGRYEIRDLLREDRRDGRTSSRAPWAMDRQGRGWREAFTVDTPCKGPAKTSVIKIDDSLMQYFFNSKGGQGNAMMNKKSEF